MCEEIVYLGLGSNLGDRKKNIDDMISSLCDEQEIELCKMSSIYETDPVGPVEQGKFLNCVIAIKTSLEPEELLIVAKDIERRLKRKDTIRWGPRTADIDILLYGSRVFKSDTLVIPHQSMWERAFVLIPLHEIASGIILPDGRDFTEHIESLEYDYSSVKKYNENE